MQLVIDPVRLSQPAKGHEREWIVGMRELLDLVTDAKVRASCPPSLRDVIHARWFREQPQSELLPVINEIIGRLQSTPRADSGQPLLEVNKTAPSYVADEFDSGERDIFIEHMGIAGVAKNDGDPHLGVLTASPSWSAEGDDVLLEGTVHAREGPGGEWYEPDRGSDALRAFLARSECIEKLLTVCCNYPCALLECPQFGVAAFGATFLKCPDMPDFEIGPHFADSLAKMNYKRTPRYAASCLRVMAQIASGNAQEVNGHEEREGPEPTKPILKVKGDTVMRAYLANRTSDANRLFWVRGAKPKFLNVAGHEGRPIIS